MHRSSQGADCFLPSGCIMAWLLCAVVRICALTVVRALHVMVTLLQPHAPMLRITVPQVRLRTGRIALACLALAGLACTNLAVLESTLWRSYGLHITRRLCWLPHPDQGLQPCRALADNLFNLDSKRNPSPHCPGVLSHRHSAVRITAWKASSTACSLWMSALRLSGVTLMS